MPQKRLISAALLAVFACVSTLTVASNIPFTQTNLVSDIPGLAAVTDPNLKNPWGMSFTPTSPFWTSDQVTGVATLYNASGSPAALIVSIPPGSPTGQVFNSTTGFLVGASPATFIFATLAGTIDAWNGAQGTVAATMHTTPGAVYTGLALGTAGASNRLYAANKASGKIDVFDSSFNPVSLGSSAFANAAVPAGLTPYNIQNIGGKLYVEYSGPKGSPGGFVAVFDTNGNLLQNIADAHLDAPWGVVIAPAGFGSFGGDLLIGNFNDGLINAFDVQSGAYLGTLSDQLGNPIANSGLWSLAFRNTSAPNANTGADPEALFFTAGINGEVDGLFGKITPAAAASVPEPGGMPLLGISVLAAVLGSRRRRAAALQTFLA